ncbi:protein FAM246C-like [Equus asinus]|uniref:protein FAM246C-like n=1 Tax=Equus asinus TaxID=9793 RepID=UPI0038F67A00
MLHPGGPIGSVCDPADGGGPWSRVRVSQEAAGASRPGSGGAVRGGGRSGPPGVAGGCGRCCRSATTPGPSLCADGARDARGLPRQTVVKSLTRARGAFQLVTEAGAAPAGDGAVRRQHRPRVFQEGGSSAASGLGRRARRRTRLPAAEPLWTRWLAPGAVRPSEPPAPPPPVAPPLRPRFKERLPSPLSPAAVRPCAPLLRC